MDEVNVRTISMVGKVMSALLLLAAAVGGTGIWFAPVISEVVCLVMALAFMGRFWKSNRTLAAA